MATPHIQVILADEIIPSGLQQALQQVSATAGFSPLTEVLRRGRSIVADAVVLVVPEDTQPLSDALGVLFQRLAEHPCAALVVTAAGNPVTPIAHPPSVPVSVADSRNDHDLAVRLAALLEVRASLDTLQRRAQASRRNGESVAKRYSRQLRLASQVQRQFLPESLPRLGSASFDVVFKPVDYVSGDIYDVHRLDEDHIGIALADATGHGIPAALLTVYIKRALRGKEIENGSYRILSPDEVLARLNEDILEAQLSECQFVAAIYGVLNVRTLELELARGGTPYPLLRRADGRIEAVAPHGGVVGVLNDAQFEVAHVQLEHGDSMLMFSDGLERVVSPDMVDGAVPNALVARAQRLVGEVESAVGEARAEHHASAAAAAGGPTSDNAAGAAVATAVPVTTAAPATIGLDNVSCNQITRSAWFRTFRERGVAAALHKAEGRQRTLRRMGYPLDDLTMLSLQIDP